MLHGGYASQHALDAVERTLHVSFVTGKGRVIQLASQKMPSWTTDVRRRDAGGTIPDTRGKNRPTRRPVSSALRVHRLVLARPLPFFVLGAAGDGDERALLRIAAAARDAARYGLHRLHFLRLAARHHPHRAHGRSAPSGIALHRRTALGAGHPFIAPPIVSSDPQAGIHA